MPGFFQIVINSENKKGGLIKTNNLSTYLLRHQEIQHMFFKDFFLALDKNSDKLFL